MAFVSVELCCPGLGGPASCKSRLVTWTKLEAYNLPRLF